MFRNYLAAAFRNLARNKLYAAINIMGLTVGFAAAMLIALFVRDELSYDRWLPSSAGIYMLSSKLAIPNQKPLRTNLIPEEIAPAIKLEFAGVDKIVRLQPDKFGLRHNQIEFAEQRVYFADPEFFSVIQFPALAGDLTTALNEPDSVVITRAAARKYFGKDAPIGEVLELDRATSLTVTAVLKDLPSNTQFNTEVLISSRSRLSSATRREPRPPQSLGWAMGDYPQSLGSGAGSYTYFTLKPGAEMEHVEAGLSGLIAKYKPGMIKTIGPSPLFVVPMTAFHLQSGIQGGAFATLNLPGDLNTVKTIAVVGMLVVFIAAINFVSLSTARASRRAVEVAVRKTAGAQSPDLILQFIGESLMYVGLGMIMAMAVVEIALPAFNANLQRTISFDFWADPRLLGGIVATTLVVGISAGAYPAFVLSRFRPTTTLKISTAQGASSLLRSALVVSQFAILIGLIAMTFVVARQTTYALDHGVKLDTNRVYVMPRGCADAVQNGVKALPGVVGIACSGDQVLGVRSNTNFITLKDGTEITVDIGPTGFGFFELYDIKPLKGRVFQRNRADQPADGPSSNPYQSPQSTAWPLIVNETLARKINTAGSDVTAAVGQAVTFRNVLSEIIAVVPDFAVDAAHHVIPPTVYYMMAPRNLSEDGLLSLKLKPGAEKATFKAIDKLWKDVGQPRSVSRYAMKGFLENLNADLIAQAQTFAAFSALAIFIAALGLFGLSAFTAERRTKEIGIRKAMGAGVGEILHLLLWQFAKPVLWANLIAWPAAFWTMNRWLHGFAYHIELQPWMFAAAGVGGAAIALLTVSAHSLLVARTRPVLALRYE